MARCAGRRRRGAVVERGNINLVEGDGVVLCAQVRALDVRARNGRRIETAPGFVVDPVLDCLRDILDD